MGFFKSFLLAEEYQFVPFHSSTSSELSINVHCKSAVIPGAREFPTNMDRWHCGRDEIDQFAREAAALGVQVMGLCCGNAAHYTRSMAEAIGRVTPASK